MQEWLHQQFLCENQALRLRHLIELRQTLRKELCRVQRCVEPADVVCEQMVIFSGCYRTCDLLMKTTEALLERHFRSAGQRHLCPQSLECPLCRLHHNLVDWLLRIALADNADQRRRAWALTRVLSLFSIRRRCGVNEAVLAAGLPAADVDNLLNSAAFVSSLPVSVSAREDSNLHTYN